MAVIAAIVWVPISRSVASIRVTIVPSVAVKIAVIIIVIILSSDEHRSQILSFKLELL